MLDISISVSVLYLVNILIAIIIVFIERKDPASTFSWVLLLLIFPVVGIFLYLLFSQNYRGKTLFLMKNDSKNIFNEYIKKQKEIFSSKSLIFKDKNTQNYMDIIRMNLFYNNFSYTQNNYVTILTDGEEKFKDLFDCINKAKTHIHIEYYIIRNDKLGNTLLNLLKTKAKEGIEVRLLFDSIGSREITKALVEDLKRANIQVGIFFSSKISFFNYRINYRNHRKIIVIDGETGYIGGFNVGDEYIGLKKKFGYWRDTHLKIQGDAVIDLQNRFMLDWSNASKEALVYFPKYFPDNQMDGSIGIQIVSSGPDNLDETIKYNYIKMLNSAKKSVLIQTPYFIPDSSLMESLKLAAMSGVEVKIMIPCIPDHPFVYWATYWHCGELLKYGVKVYIYEHGFLHAKTLTVDNSISSVGTANFDFRSFKLNFECNAIIYDTNFALSMNEIFENDLNFCSELTIEKYLQRDFAIKIKESVSRLFSPLL